jgi:hypothetical protein
MKLRHPLILSVFGFLLCALSWAEDNNVSLVSLPSEVDYTNGSGWAVGIGLQIESSAIFHGSGHYELNFNPEGAVQWRNDDYILFWEGFDLNNTELGWRGLIQSKWLVEAGVRHEIVIPSSRSEKAGIDNLPHRGSHILGFFESKYLIGDRWETWASGRILAGSNEYGWQAKASLGHSFVRGVDNEGTELILFSTFGSKDNLNNYFGVSEFDSTVSGLQSIDLDGGYRSSGLDVIYRENIRKNTQITAKVGIEIYSSQIKKSELVRDSSEINAKFSVVWMF